MLKLTRWLTIVPETEREKDMNKNGQTRKQLIIRAIFFAAVVAVIALFAYINRWNSAYWIDGYEVDVQELESGWTCVNEDGTTETTDLPYYFKESETGTQFSLKKKLSFDYSDEILPHILVSVKYENLKVFVGNHEIYSYEVPENGISKTGGALFLFVQLPPGWQGQTLELQYTQLLGNGAKYQVSAPIIGDKMDIYRSLLRKEALGIILDFCIALVGIILIVSDLILTIKGKNYVPFLLLGIFSVNCAVYFATQSICINVAISNSYVAYTMEYVALLLGPVEIGLLLYSYMKGKSKKLVGAISGVAGIYALIVIILDIFYKVDFKETLPVTDAFILAFSGTVFLIYILNKDSRESKRLVVRSFFPFIIGGVLDVFLYYLNVPERPCLKLGFLFFALLQIYYNYKRVTDLHSQNIKAETYRIMAYQDALTGIGNRAAYVRDVEILQRKIHENYNLKKYPGCLSVDANRLKQINDEYGHAKGDLLIIEVSDLLNRVIKNDGSVYRVGGDEFIVLFPEISEYEILQVRKKLENMRTKYNEDRSFPVSFSVGTAVYRPDDVTLERMVVRADAAMYREKEKYHEMDKSI